MALLTGPDHLIQLANPGYLKLVGNRPVIGRTVAIALPEAVDQGYLELLDRAYRSGEAFTAFGAKYAIHTPDGVKVERQIDFVYQPIKGPAGSVTGIFVEGVDVTERTLATELLSAAQADLIRSEEQLRLATEAAEVGLWDVDLLTDTMFWPPRVKAMFGISPEEPVSMADFYAGLHPNDRSDTSEAFAGAMDPSRRSVYDVEYRTVGKEDGVIRWVAAKGRGIFDGDGRCIRAIGTAIDISRRKQTEALLTESEARLRAAMEALQDADRKKDQFLATLSHELRNPLTALRHALTLVARNRDSRTVIERVRHIMERQVEQLVRLTDDLLDVSRITLGKMNLRSEEVALGSILERAAESCMQSVEGAEQHLAMSLPDRPVTIHGDSARLVQLFGNLISNASKFSPAGGHIDVDARLQDAMLRISIKDSGIGMAADKLVCIFDPFTQLETPVGRSNSGLGIGLALSRQLVEMHGGTIEARSEGPGRGSEFIVMLPLQNEG